MLLGSSVKPTIGHVADSVFLGRDSNRYPDCYRANSIHESNDNNYNNKVDDLTNLGNSSLYHASRCGSKHCQYQISASNIIPVNIILSTTTNRKYKCMLMTPMSMTTPPTWFILSLTINANL